MKIKRYLLFAWPLYRSWGGGWDDFIGSYDTRCEAYEDFKKDYNDGNEGCFNIVDLTTLQIVKSHRDED